MNLLKRLIHRLLPKHLRNHPLHPEYKEVKHTETGEGVLQMPQQDEHFTVSLTGNGRWKEKAEKRSYHGIGNMEKRCAQNSFGFHLNHIKGMGTRVEITAPVVPQTVQSEPA